MKAREAKRDVRIEFYRCACMFGVVLLHALTQGGYADPHRGLDNLMTPSVVGFVFISGYFGLQFKWRSVLRLLGIGLSSMAMITLVHQVICQGDSDCGRFIVSMLRHLKGTWFIWMYLALMTIAPVINPLFEIGPDRTVKGISRRILPFAVTIFIWSYVATKVPVLKIWIPAAGGFGAFGVLTFIGVYLVARFCRVSDVETKLSTRVLLLTAAAGGTMCWIGFQHYHSPFAMVFAGSMFYLFKRLPIEKVGERFEKLILFSAPSMFGIYLLHTNDAGFALLRQAEDWMVAEGWNYYVMSFVVTLSIYFSCLLLDLLRRGSVSLVKIVIEFRRHQLP